MVFNFEKASRRALDIDMRMAGVREELEDLESQIESLEELRCSFSATDLDDEVAVALRDATDVGVQALQEEMLERILGVNLAQQAVEELKEQEQGSLGETINIRQSLQEKLATASAQGIDGDKLYENAIAEAKEYEASLQELDAYLSEMDDELAYLIEKFSPGGRQRDRKRARLSAYETTAEGIRAFEDRVINDV